MHQILKQTIVGVLFYINLSDIMCPIIIGDIMTEKVFNTSAQVAKVDDELGLVFGFAIVSKINGEEYYDVQGDHIPEGAMLEAATDFMMNSRVAKDMHLEDGELPGSIVFAFPLTEDISKALEIQTNKTGLLIAMKPESSEILQKFKDGSYTGFSIGGKRIQDEEMED